MDFNQDLEGITWTGEQKIINTTGAKGIVFRNNKGWNSVDFFEKVKRLPKFGEFNNIIGIENSINGLFILEDWVGTVIVSEYNIGENSVFKLSSTFPRTGMQNIRVFPGGFARRNMLDRLLAEYQIQYVDGNIEKVRANYTRNWYATNGTIITKEHDQASQPEISHLVAHYADETVHSRYLHVSTQLQEFELVMPMNEGLIVYRKDEILLIDNYGISFKKCMHSQENFNWKPHSMGFATKEDLPHGARFTVTYLKGDDQIINLKDEVFDWVPFG